MRSRIPRAAQLVAAAAACVASVARPVPPAPGPPATSSRAPAPAVPVVDLTDHVLDLTDEAVRLDAAAVVPAQRFDGADEATLTPLVPGTWRIHLVADPATRRQAQGHRAAAVTGA